MDFDAIDPGLEELLAAEFDQELLDTDGDEVADELRTDYDRDGDWDTVDRVAPDGSVETGFDTVGGDGVPDLFTSDDGDGSIDEVRLVDPLTGQEHIYGDFV